MIFYVVGIVAALFVAVSLEAGARRIVRRRRARAPRYLGTQEYYDSIKRKG